MKKIIKLKNLSLIFVFFIILSCSKAEKEIKYTCAGVIDATVSADRRSISIEIVNSGYKDYLYADSTTSDGMTTFTNGKTSFGWYEDDETLFTSAGVLDYINCDKK